MSENIINLRLTIGIVERRGTERLGSSRTRWDGGWPRSFGQNTLLPKKRWSGSREFPPGLPHHRSECFQGPICFDPSLREDSRPRVQTDALPVTVCAPGRVTLTLANAADHENEQSGGRCGPHCWVLWNMIVIGDDAPLQCISGTAQRAPRHGDTRFTVSDL